MPWPGYLGDRDMSDLPLSRSPHRSAFTPRLEARPLPRRQLDLDETDAKILRELLLGEQVLFRSERTSLEAIARRLGVHRNTVAARLQRMVAAGGFLPLTLTVEPSQMGLKRGVLWMELAPARRTEETLRSLWLVEGLQAVLQYHEGWLLIQYAEDERTVLSRGELAGQLCGGVEGSWEVLTWRDYEPRPPLRLTNTDLGIIRVLLQNARMPFPRIAKVLGVSSRTVERRFENLARTGAIMVMPAGTGTAKGMVMGHLRVYLSAQGGRRRELLTHLDASLPEAVVRNLQHPKFASWVIMVPTVRDVESRAALVRSTPGVQKVGVRLLLGYRPNPRWPEWLVATLERKVPVRPRLSA